MVAPTRNWLTKNQIVTRFSISSTTLGKRMKAGTFPRPTFFPGDTKGYWNIDTIDPDSLKVAPRIKGEENEPPPDICHFKDCRRPPVEHDVYRLNMCSTHTKRAHTILNRRKP